jgi:hypothetical protein
MNSIWQKMRKFWQGLDPFWQKFFMVVAVIVGPYYLMSPYENCMREQGSAYFCTKLTTW